MVQQWFALAALVLAVSCSKESQEHCHKKKCPDYNITAKYSGFEERAYPTTTWIQTLIEKPDGAALLAAHSRLKSYCQNLPNPDESICDTWPVLVYKEVKGDNVHYFMQWFVPPGLSAPQGSDPGVTVITKLNLTLYVGVSDGSPSLEKAEQNCIFLQKDLDNAHKRYNNLSFIAAFYDSYFAFFHHNEIWIFEA